MYSSNGRKARCSWTTRASMNAFSLTILKDMKTQAPLPTCVPKTSMMKSSNKVKKGNGEPTTPLLKNTMMKVRIKFDADIVLEGGNMKEIKSKWLSLPLFSNEALNHSLEFGEVILVEDGETYEDLMTAFDKA